MWNVKCMRIPAVIGAAGIVTKRLKKYLGTIRGKHSVDSLQRWLYMEHHVKPEQWGSPLVQEQKYQDDDGRDVTVLRTNV
jgi:hypothetical protein